MSAIKPWDPTGREDQHEPQPPTGALACQHVRRSLLGWTACDEPAELVAYVNQRNDDDDPEARMMRPGVNLEIAVCQDCLADLDDDPETYVIETWDLPTKEQ